ncbi:MAG TPA: hypothetical protein VFB56_04415 [Nitrospiraceae bacterium]|nr:hypothetical protein [Nitrospiraceae bacterium]
MCKTWLYSLILALSSLFLSESEAFQVLGNPSRQLEQQIPILGVMMRGDRSIGTVTHIVVSFAERSDATGLAVIFPGSVGKLSPMAQTSTEQGIYRAARVAGLSTDSWTVMVTVVQPNVTIYGNSLSAMVGLTVIAMAKGETILPDRVVTRRDCPGWAYLNGRWDTAESRSGSTRAPQARDRTGRDESRRRGLADTVPDASKSGEVAPAGLLRPHRQPTYSPVLDRPSRIRCSSLV